MTLRRDIVAVIISGSILVSGCISRPPQPIQVAPYQPRQVTDVIKTSYIAADALISQIVKILPAAESSLIAATLVNINRLDESSPLGRLISEHLSARFAQNGYRIIETKLRNQLYMKRDTGELILSREVREIAKKHSVRAIISGTYTDSADRIFVSLKIVEIEKNVVLAAFDYVLEKDAVTKSLLNPT